MWLLFSLPLPCPIQWGRYTTEELPFQVGEEKEETYTHQVHPVIFFKLMFSCSSKLCQFLFYGKVNQPSVYMYPLFFGFPSNLGHRRAPSRAPLARQHVLFIYLFYTQQCSMYQSQSLNSSQPHYPHPSVLTLFLYVCVCISALQIGSSVPFCQIPRTCAAIRYLFFSF